MTSKSVVAFLSDVLGLVAFIFLVVRGHRPVARVVTTRMIEVMKVQPVANTRAELESFVAGVFQAVDMHRRTNLAALVTIGGILGLSDDVRFAGVAVLLTLLWVVLYYVSSQLVVGVETARRQVSEMRRRLVWLFVAWSTLSVVLKLGAALMSGICLPGRIWRSEDFAGQKLGFRLP